MSPSLPASLPLRMSALHMAAFGPHAQLTHSYSIAPIILSIANYTIFSRLIEWVTPAGMAGSRQSWLRLSATSIALTITQCSIALPIAGLGLYRIGSFLSPRPIENHMGAFLRLVEYESGLRMLLVAHTAHLVASVIFGLVGVVYLVKSANWQADPHTIQGKNWRELLYTNNVVNAIIAARAVFKIYELVCIKQSTMMLGQGGPLFWLFDALPVLLALVMFCAIQPAAYLPRDLPTLVEASIQLPYADEKLLLMERDY